MPWYAYIVHFVGGAVFANGVPHFVFGISGEKFQSPFASPPGKGLSPPLTNLIWGFANFVVGYVLLVLWSPADNGARPWIDIAAIALGVLAMGLMLSSHFGRVRGNAN